MKLTGEQIKRLGIFFFYDSQGIVDDYVMTMLSGMNRHFSELLIVCNGKLSSEGRAKFESLKGSQILVRENKGYDVWAYKTAMEYYGYDRLAQVDELILFNYTIMGPVSGQSLDAMFTRMNKQDIDFWGITVHHGAPFDVWGILEEHFLPVHIQSHFIAIRNSMLKSYEFQEYWNSRPLIRVYEEAVAYHEAIFTKRFSDMGYKWAVLCDTRELIDQTLYPMFNMPVEMIRDYGCPFFKRKLFFYDIKEKLQENRNQVALALYEYLRQHTEYDVNQILQNLLRTVPMTDVVEGLNFNYIVEETDVAKVSAAIVIDTRYTGLSQLPLKELKQTADIIFIGDRKVLGDCQKLSEEEYYFIETDKSNFTNAYYALNEIKQEYEYYCFLANDEQNYIDIRNDNHSYKGIIDESMVGDSGFRAGILRLFQKNPRMGLAYPPNPVHGGFFAALNTPSRERMDCMKSFFIREGEQIEDAFLVGCVWQFTGCFWCRGEIIRGFIERYPKTSWEKVSKNQNIVFSAALSVWAQRQSYYAARIYSKGLAQNYLTNEERMLRCINGVSYNDKLNFSGLCDSIGIKNQHARCYAYYDYGDGFLNLYRQKVDVDYDSLSDGVIAIHIPVPEGVKQVRLQLAEGLFSIAEGATCDNPALEVTVQGGIRDGRYDIFNNPYPQYRIKGDFTECREFIMSFETLSFFYSTESLDSFLNMLGEKNGELSRLSLELNDYHNDCYNKKVRLKQLEERLEELKCERDVLEQFRQEVTNSRTFRLLHMFDRKRGKK